MKLFLSILLLSVTLLGCAEQEPDFYEMSLQELMQVEFDNYPPTTSESPDPKILIYTP